MLDWTAHLVIPAALLAAAGMALAVLLLTLKRHLRPRAEGERVEIQQLTSAVAEIRAALDQLRQEIDRRHEAAAEAARPVSGMNLSKRGQVLRMHRRGERPEQIAAALSLPLGEVDLLVKVHRTLAGPAA